MTQLSQDDQTGGSKGLSRWLLDVLKSLDVRLRSCFSDPISTKDAYDSFYQEMVAEAIAKLSTTGAAE